MTTSMFKRMMIVMVLGTAAWTTPVPATAEPETLRIAMVNMVCLNSNSADAAANRRNIQANLDRHLAFIDLAVAGGAEFVGFPEVSINVYAILHNHANLANPELAIAPPAANGRGWASGAWVIGPDGSTLAQMPATGDRAGSVEYLLIHDIPVAP